jgi:hypothetical protein
MTNCTEYSLSSIYIINSIFDDAWSRMLSSSEELNLKMSEYASRMLDTVTLSLDAPAEFVRSLLRGCEGKFMESQSCWGACTFVYALMS